MSTSPLAASLPAQAGEGEGGRNSARRYPERSRLHKLLPGFAVLDQLVEERRRERAAVAPLALQDDWARVTEVRSSPMATSTTETSFPERTSSSSSASVT